MSALPQPSHWDGVLFPSTHYGSSDSAIISHVLYGRTISIWLNVSFVVGGNNDDDLPTSTKSNEHESTSTSTSTSSSTSSTNNNNYNNKNNNNDGNEYTLEGVARKVVNEVRNILASAQIQTVTAKNSVHIKEYNYVYVPGYDLQQQKNNNNNGKKEKKEKEEKKKNFIDDAPVANFMKKYPNAIVTGVIIARDAHTGTPTMFDSRNCGLACEAIHTSKTKYEKEQNYEKAKKGIKKNYLNLWQLRRFLSVWKELSDAPHMFEHQYLEMDATKKLLSGYIHPKVIGIRAGK